MRDYHFLEKVTSSADVTVEKRCPELMRVPADATIRGVVICECLFKLNTHWHNKRRRLCRGEMICDLHESCRLLVNHLVAVWDYKEDRPIWVELTPIAGRNLLQQVERLDRSLFGSMINIGRIRKHAKAPIVATIDPHSEPKVLRTKPITPEETIARVFESAGSTRKAAEQAV